MYLWKYTIHKGEKKLKERVLLSRYIDRVKWYTHFYMLNGNSQCYSEKIYEWITKKVSAYEIIMWMIKIVVVNGLYKLSGRDRRF